MTEETNGFEGRSCRIIEVAHGLNQRNVFISLDDLEEWLKRQLDVDLYSSFFRYYTDDPYVGGVLAGFGLDFDDVDNPRRAQKEALTVIRYLMDRYDIKEEDISICFSGNKGFHVFVNHSVLGVEPHFYLPQIFKNMAKELARKHQLKTVDLKIYDRRRLIRLPNTRHQKSGLYKIPLTLTELSSLNLDQIKALAVKPRTPPARIEHKVSEKAHVWYCRHRDVFMKRLEEKRVEFTSSDFEVGGIWPCVKKRLELGAEEGMRNRYTWQLASYFCKKGLPLQETLKILRGWYQKLDQGLEPYTWEECERTIRATYEVGGYSIGCGSEFVEGLCVGKENCPLFVKREESEISEEDLQKADEILLGDPLEFIADTVNLVHVRDRKIIQIAYISALSAQLAKSIHLWPIGSSQVGKSHVLLSTLHVLPREHYELFTSASPKALFYYAKKYGENCFDGKLIFIDEVESSKLTLPMLRTLTSPTDIEPRHLSVYDADLLDLKIKGPRVIWFTSVKAFGSDQLRNRFIFVNPDESEKQDEEIFNHQKEKDEENLNVDSIEEFKIAKALTKKILEETKDLKVKIPYINAIQWPYKNRRWLFPVFKNFIKIITKIHYKQRQINGDVLISTPEDFEITKQLWASCLEHIIFRVKRPAKELLDILPNKSENAKTKAELAEETGYSTMHVKRLLEELEEAELINKQKRQKEGVGRLAYEYWRAKLPGVDDIKLISNISNIDFGLCGSKIFSNENEEGKNDVRNVNNSLMIGGVEWRRVPPGGPCEKCEMRPVEWEGVDVRDGSVIRRCNECFEEFRRVFRMVLEEPAR